MSSILVRIATTTVAALTLVLAAASPVQAAGRLGNCNDSGATTPCFEKIWSDGVQIKMTFVDLNPTPSNAPTHNFYVLAPQTRTPRAVCPSCTTT